MIGKTRQPEEARGVLVPQLPSGRFEHRRGAPSTALVQLVEHYWYVAWDMQGGPPQTQETLPHPNVHLVVEAGDAGVFGVHTARYTRQLEGQGYAFGIKFRPAGFQPFLGASLAGIADSRVAPDSIFGDGGARYVQQIRACAAASAPVAEAMTAAAESFLLARLPAADKDVGRANALVDAIAADPEMRTVEALAQHSGMNKRALQRLFQHHVGVGPKWVIKRYRMHEAVAQLQSGRLQLAQLALELGYFDQAHFIRDFAALVGKPPGAYARQVLK